MKETTNTIMHSHQNKIQTTKRNQLKIAHLNIQSISNKLDELKHYIATNNIDIMSVNETWLSANKTINISNHTILRKDRTGAAH
jgi:hypothetical protein